MFFRHFYGIQSHAKYLIIIFARIQYCNFFILYVI